MTAPNVVVEPWYLMGWSNSISPSSLGRAFACIRSEAMPHASSNSDAASRGTIIHKFLADALDFGPDAALGMVEDPSDVDWLSCIPLDKLPAFERESYAAEVAIAYNPEQRSAREVGRNISREEARRRATADEIVGIIDVLGVAAMRALVHDYKTGWGDVEAAINNWQLRTYALFAARCFDRTSVTYSIIRVRDNGSVWNDVASMDEFDLLDHEDELRKLLQRRNRVRQLVREMVMALLRGEAWREEWAEIPPVVEGKWCKYCPAFASCPAKGQAIVGLARQDNIAELKSVERLNEALAAAAYPMLRQAKTSLDKYISILEAYARDNPVPLGDGEFYGEHPTTRRRIVPERAKRALERFYGPLGVAVAGEATKREESMPQDRLRAALRKLVLPTLPSAERRITWLERDVNKLLTENGAWSVVTTRPVTVFTPAKVVAPLDLTPPVEASADDEESAA